MPRRKKYLLLLTGLAALAILILLSRMFSQPSWNEDYRYQNKGAYGTSVLYALLEKWSPELVPLYQRPALELRQNPSGSYVFIGETLYMDSVGAQALLQFVGRGNHAFIASCKLPYALLAALNPDVCIHPLRSPYPFYQDTQVFYNLQHPSLAFPKPLRFVYQRPVARDQPRASYYWEYIDPTLPCAPKNLAQLGNLNGRRINFVRIPYEKGFFYIHTTPILFSNLALLDEKRTQYAFRALSHLPSGKLLWDNYSKNPPPESTENNTPGKRQLQSNSPLGYILSQPSLALAWYLILFAGLLFLLFRTRRRQRVIPVLPTRQNHTLEFVKAIGRLHFLQQDHRRIALQNMKFFLQTLRERYALHGLAPDSPAAVDIIQSKTNLPRQPLEQLFRMHQNIQRASRISEGTLIQFQQILAQVNAYLQGKGSL